MSLPTNAAETQVAIGGNLRIGSTVRDVLSETTPSHNWTLPAKQGNTIVIQLSRVDGNAKFRLHLVSPDGNILTELDTQQNDYAVSIPFILPKEGEYSVLVSRIEPNTQGMYAISVSDGTQTVSRNTTTGTPGSPTPSLVITATATPSLTFTPPVPTETPTIAATSSPVPVTATPAAIRETTQITASNAPLPPGGRLEIGESRAGEITQPGEIHRFTFFGAAGEVVSLTMNLDPAAPGTLNPYIELQAPNGTVIAQNDSWLPNVLDALIGQFELPATGVYTLYAKSRDGAGRGRYFISISDGFTLRDVERGEALQNLPNEQHLETYGQRDVWKIQAEAGDLISVAVEVVDRAGDFDVMAELVSPDGESWFDDDSGADNDAFLDKIEAPVTGEYIIHVAARNNASIGIYRLWWQIASEPPTPAPLPPTLELPAAPVATSATISEEIIGTVGENRSSTYTVEIRAGQTVTIAVQGVESFDSVLRVMDAVGNILVEVDDVGESVDPQAYFVAETSGLYTIEITGFEGASGSFTLTYEIQ